MASAFIAPRRVNTHIDRNKPNTHNKNTSHNAWVVTTLTMPPKREGCDHIEDRLNDNDKETESVYEEETATEEEADADTTPSPCSPMKSQRTLPMSLIRTCTRQKNVSSYVRSIIGRHHHQVAVQTKWNIMFSQLLEHYKQMGTWIISQNSHKEKALYNWLYEQRVAYRRGYLKTKTPERFESLTKAGVPLEIDHWNRHGEHPDVERKWNERYEELKDYYTKHHTKMVSLQSRPELYHWIHWQRKTFRRGRMAPHRIEKLREIGCLLEKQCFSRDTKAHSDIKKDIGGGSNNINSSIADDVATAKGAITATTKNNATRDCGWEPQFQKMLDQLVRWHDLHGTWYVKASENESLYRFVLKCTSSKTRRSKELRTPARMAKLRAVGFPIPGDDLLFSHTGLEDQVEGHAKVNVAAQTRKRKADGTREEDAVTRRPKRRMPCHPHLGA
jgi:hypothetical protein